MTQDVGHFWSELVFHDTYELKFRKELFVAVEDSYTDQLVYCGAIGSCKAIKKTSEGTVFSPVEEKDRAHLTRTSDTLCMIGGHSDDERKTRSLDVGKPQDLDVNRGSAGSFYDGDQGCS